MASKQNADFESDPAALLSSLQERADCLLADLRAFQACLAAHNKQKEVEIRNFKRGVESEVKSLVTASQIQQSVQSESDLTESELEEQELKHLHALRSSNLPFYESVWAVARQYEGIMALGKRVYCNVPSISRSQSSHKNESPDGTVIDNVKSERKSAVVDIVAKEGQEWIKVSTITEKRLLFEMAKEGWEGYGDDSDSTEYDEDERVIGDRDKKSEPTQLELVKLANILRTASRDTRINYRHPHVRFILPKIQEGIFDDVDAVIADIRSLGIQVTCSNTEDSSGHSNPSSPLQNHNLQPAADLTYLLPSSSIFSPIPTPTLNIDCTILLALISDISHIHSSDLPPHPKNLSGHYHKAITRQINAENISPLLPTEVYPFLSNKTLTCTAAAAQRMREIVQTMGTDTERARADILLGENTYNSATHRESLTATMRRFSCHGVPPDLNLPIKVVTHDSIPELLRSTNRPANEGRVIEKLIQRMNLSAINESVFLYGWCIAIVTVTSNRAMALGLVKCVNEILDDEEEEQESWAQEEDRMQFEGPKMYVCETARSLIGKEKQGHT